MRKNSYSDFGGDLDREQNQRYIHYNKLLLEILQWVTFHFISTLSVNMICHWNHMANTKKPLNK